MKRRLAKRWHRMQRTLYRTGIRSAKGLTLPKFLGIGAQKAGTTWLHENLRAHPDLFLPEPKEVHYFDSYFQRPLKWYASHFEKAGNRMAGEITPGYSIVSEDRVAFVRKVMPNLKLIFLMRNPIDRAWSQALMNLVTLPERKMKSVDEAEFIAHFKDARSVQRGEYLAILEKWEARFPEDRFYIDIFEAIERDPQTLLRRIFLHLGVTVDVDWSQFPYNEVIFKGPDRPIPEALQAFLEGFYHDDIERLHERFGDLVAPWRT